MMMERLPIYEAACERHTEIVKILAPLTDNPNATTINGKTPIDCAKEFGHTDIVKILESFQTSKKCNTDYKK